MINGTRFLLLALLGGVGTGLLVRAAGDASLVHVVAALKPVGALWLAALKMTLVPLVFSLTAGAANTLLAARTGGRTIATTVAVFAAMLCTATIAAMAATTALLRLWPVPQGMLAVLIRGAKASPVAVPPGLAGQIMGLIPDNPIAAAAQAQIAPLIVFALSFGWAISRLAPERRVSLETTLAAIADAMMAIVKAVLAVAPVGVFVLAMEATIEVGTGLVTLLAQAVAMLVLLASAAILACHALARFGGAVSWGRFARGAAPLQMVAAGTCSSMACLPPLLAAAEEELGVEPPLARAVLPLAVSTFRLGTAVSLVFSVLFAARAAGLVLGPEHYAIAALLIVLTNSGVVGLPGAAVIYATEAPIFQAIGAPVAFIPLWIAVFALPDIFVTVANVTADLSALTLIRRLVAPSSRPVAPAPRQSHRHARAIDA